MYEEYMIIISIIITMIVFDDIWCSYDGMMMMMMMMMVVMMMMMMVMMMMMMIMGWYK